MKHPRLALFLLLASQAGCIATADPTASPPTSLAAGSTGPTNAFFLPTGGKPDNTSAPVIRLDGHGFTHALYPSYAVGGAYYAFCGVGCDGAAAVKTVRFETDGTVTNAMLTLTAAGQPRVLLSAYQHVYFASCDQNCTEQANWFIAPILSKGVDQEVTGDAFALDPQDRPRFLMHTHVAYLGIGQGDPSPSYVTCDSTCTSPSSWTASVIAPSIWQGTTLRFDQSGVAKVATVSAVDGGADQIVYLECGRDCGTPSGWVGTALGPSFASESDIVAIHPRAQLALTTSGAPRILALASDEGGSRGLAYMSCDHDCASATATWPAAVIGKGDRLGAGYSLALDAADHPFVAYTLDYDIALATSADGATFATSVLEDSTALPSDQIFLNDNCTVGGWLFHDPSIAVTGDGHLRVGYQARDASAGGATSDGEHAACTAGTDMSWSRLAIR